MPPPSNPRSLPVIVATLVLAMVLRILPLPHDWLLFNPDWIALFLIYWTMALPERVGVGTACITGLFTDALTGRMLGQHGVAYSVLAYLTLRWYRRLRLYPLPQQALWVMTFLLANQLLILWTQNIKQTGDSVTWRYWLPSLSGAALWPFVFVLLRWVRRQYRLQ